MLLQSYRHRRRLCKSNLNPSSLDHHQLQIATSTEREKMALVRERASESFAEVRLIREFLNQI